MENLIFFIKELNQLEIKTLLSFVPLNLYQIMSTLIIILKNAKTFC